MLRSILMVTASVVVTAILSAVVVVLALFSEPGKQSRRLAHIWAKIILYITGTGIEVIGKENIITERPQIFMANHQSDFDILIFLAAIPADFLWTAKKELFRVPVFGKAMRKAGYIEIDRQDHEKALLGLQEAAERIKEGISIATFPEGTRSRDGRLLPFKQGTFYLAIETCTPIVPVTIIGSGKIMPKRSLKIRPGRITMAIGKPVDVGGYTIETRAALIEEVRSIIAANLDSYQTEAANGPDREPR